MTSNYPLCSSTFLSLTALTLTCLVAALVPLFGNNSTFATEDASTTTVTVKAPFFDESRRDDKRAQTAGWPSQMQSLSGNLVPATISGQPEEIQHKAQKTSAAAEGPRVGDINTVAGGPGWGTATSVGQEPGSLAVRNGVLYATDFGQSVVRSTNLTTGVVSVVVGNGSPGFNGDGGPASSAQLANPAGIALDADGNIYIADTFNHRIRKIDAITQLITTVAGNGIKDVNGDGGYSGDGGAATAASLNAPAGIAFDSAGNLYIADRYNNRVRKVVPGADGVLNGASDETITTVAGIGIGGFSGDGGPAILAQLFSPTGVALDAGGNLYIADADNHRIRKVDAALALDGTQHISTVAGTGAVGVGGYGGDGGPATSALLLVPFSVTLDAGNLYIADVYNHRIRKVVPGADGVLNGGSDEIINTIAGNGAYGFSGDGGPATSAQLNLPFNLTFDVEGNLYIADTGNDRIRKVDAIPSADGTQHIRTIAGNGFFPGRYGGDDGPAIASQLYSPNAIAFDRAGNLYIADRFNSRIRKVDAAPSGDGTRHITTVAGDGTVGFGGDGGPAPFAELRYPYGIALDDANNLYIVDSQNHRIRKVDVATSIITTVAGSGAQGFSGDGGPATSAELNFPAGIAFDAAGHLYIAEEGNRRIRKVDMASNIIITVAGSEQCLDFVTNCDGGPATLARLNNPRGLAFDSANNLYIADTGNDLVRKVDAATQIITTVAGTSQSHTFSGDGGPATVASLAFPSTLAFDGAGNLYIADSSNNRIRKVDANGVITTVAGTGPNGGRSGEYSGDGGPATSAQLNFPWGVALDPKGNIYISDTDNNRVRAITVFTLPILRVVSRKTHGPAGDFNINLPITGTPGIECRREQTPGNHHLVFSFSSAVTVNDATVSPATGKTAEKDGPPVRSADGKEIILNLKNVTNAQRVTIALVGVSDGTNTNDVSVQVGVLLGDTTGDGVVDSGDITQTRRQSGQVTGEPNKRIDLTTDGVINSGDITLVRRQSGTALPTP